jgi:hypothetical protein
MNQAKTYAEEFAILFSGNQQAHGVFEPDKEKPKDGEKAKGKSYTLQEQVTEGLFLSHLRGTRGLGISPINKDGKVNFAVIDVDKYPINPLTYIVTLNCAKVAGVCFKSKSGGLHIYVFFSKPAEAAKARSLMASIAGLFGLPKTTEIFPKQVTLENGGIGNWINLPYFDYEKTERYAYNTEGAALSIDDAIKFIKGSRQPLQQFVDALAAAPLAKAPPCLQTIFLSGGAGKGQRNDYLFNVATYLKARYGKEDYESHLHTANAAMLLPLPLTELNATIVSSQNKNNYAYNCRCGTLAAYCDKDTCMTREYGIGGGNVNSLNYGTLTIFRGLKNSYTWEVNGKELYFDDVSALSNHENFRRECLEKLQLAVHRVKEVVWTNTLQMALDNAVFMDQDTQGLSDEALWIGCIEEYCIKKRTNKLSDVANGMVVWDAGFVYMRSVALLNYLHSTQTFGGISPRIAERYVKQTLGGDYVNLTRTAFKGRVIRLKQATLRKLGMFNNPIRIVGKEDQVRKDDITPIQYLDENEKSKF